MIHIHGTITDPSGQSVAGAMIELRALNSTAEVLAGSVLTIKCDASGSYDFQLGIGAYDVYAQNDYQGDMDYLGAGAVSAASVDGPLLSILVDGGINLTPPLLDTAHDAMQRAVSSAASAAADREQTGIDAQTATDKAAAAALSESESKSARDSIVSDAADVRQKAVAIESARQEVASNTVTVGANTAATTASAADAARDAASALASKNDAKASADTAATLKSDVESMRDAVSANASTAVAAADTASQKAAGAAQSEAVASSAATRAEQAAQAVAAALIDAGPYDASTGVLPSPAQVSGVNKSCIWKVTCSGTAGGIELGVGDSLIYTTHGPSYYKIDNTESVASVNGQKGIVTLTASNVGADAAGTSSDHITQHEAKVGAHAISGVAGLQGALDGKIAAARKDVWQNQGMVTDLNAVTNCGFFVIGTATAVNGPNTGTPSYGHGWLATDGTAAGSAWRQQFASMHAGDIGYGLWTRRFVNEKHSPWEKILTSETAIGSITYGAIIERGSNSNGEYVKFADGTMICTFPELQGYLSNPSNISFVGGSAGSSKSFASAFSAAPSISSQLTIKSFSVISPAGNLIVSGVTASSILCAYLINKAASFNQEDANNTTLLVTAIGRWK